MSLGALNVEWAKTHPDATLVAFSISDDGMLIWLSDRSKAAADFAKHFLWNYSPLKVGGSDVNGTFVDYSGTVQHSGLRRIDAGQEAAEFIGVAASDDRVADVIGIATVGTVYSDPTKIKKISEHGGDARQDRHVPIIVWGGGIGHDWIDDKVETTQIAPTVFELLGVNKEGTRVLPDLSRN